VRRAKCSEIGRRATLRFITDRVSNTHHTKNVDERGPVEFRIHTYIRYVRTYSAIRCGRGREYCTHKGRSFSRNSFQRFSSVTSLSRRTTRGSRFLFDTPSTTHTPRLRDFPTSRRPVTCHHLTAAESVFPPLVCVLLHSAPHRCSLRDRRVPHHFRLLATRKENNSRLRTCHVRNTVSSNLMYVFVREITPPRRKCSRGVLWNTRAFAYTLKVGSGES